MTTTPGTSGHTVAPQFTTPTSETGQRRRRIVGRWLVSFLGFPIGGYLAFLLIGPADSTTAALAGGLIVGAVLGAAQAWGLGRRRPKPVTWVAGTAVGLAAGMALGSSVADYATDLDGLLMQGAVTGAGVGLAQAGVLLPRLGSVALLWPVALTGLWSLGWLVTDSIIGGSVDQQFYVFGSSGALVVTALTSALPLALNHRSAHTEATAPPR